MGGNRKWSSLHFSNYTQVIHPLLYDIGQLSMYTAISYMMCHGSVCMLPYVCVCLLQHVNSVPSIIHVVCWGLHVSPLPSTNLGRLEVLLHLVGELVREPNITHCAQCLCLHQLHVLYCIPKVSLLFTFFSTGTSESYNTGQNSTTIVCEMCRCNQREQVMGPTSSTIGTRLLLSCSFLDISLT